jgi:hypothetical protein
MRLEHLYRVRFIYPEGWGINIEGEPRNPIADLVLEVAELIWEPIDE